MDNDQLKQKVKILASDINNMRRDISLAIRFEEYEKAAQLRDEAKLLQKELLQIIMVGTTINP